MKRLFGLLVQWIANIWSIILLIAIALWVMTYFGVFSDDSNWIAINYFPPFWFILFLVPPALIYIFRKFYKRTLILVAIYLVVFIAFGDVALLNSPSYSFKKDDKTQKVSVVAINLRYYSFGFDKIVSAINKLDADLYLLSENDITAEQIKKMKQLVAPKSFHMGYREGTAIISKYPVLKFETVPLPTRQASLFDGNTIEEVEKNPYRSFVHAVIDVNGVPLHAISIRFIAGRSEDKKVGNLLDFGFYLLKSQLKEIRFFREYIKSLKGPVIFGGDLNATPSSIIVRELSRFATDLYLQDHIWGGFTFGTSFPPKTNYPIARLDYLFAMNQIQLLKSKMLDLVISDHYPVFAECLIPAEMTSLQ